MGFLGREVGHHPRVLVVLHVDVDPGLLPQPGIGTIRRHQKISLDLAAVRHHQGMGMFAPGHRLGTLGEQGDIARLPQRLPEGELNPPVLGDPGQFR